MKEERLQEFYAFVESKPQKYVNVSHQFEDVLEYFKGLNVMDIGWNYGEVAVGDKFAIWWL